MSPKRPSIIKQVLVSYQLVFRDDSPKAYLKKYTCMIYPTKLLIVSLSPSLALTGISFMPRAALILALDTT